VSGKVWTDAKLTELALVYMSEVTESGLSGAIPRTARRLGVTRNSAEHALHRHPQWEALRRRGQAANLLHEPEPLEGVGVSTPRITAPLFDVGVPRGAGIVEGDTLRAVLFGDVHEGFEDDRALNILRAITPEFDPHVIACMGDLLDCYKLSRFDKDPTRIETLQDEINKARTLLHEMAQLAPRARRVFFEGNHEDRLRRTIWNLADAGKVLVELDDFREAMTWERLLRLDQIGWEFVPYLGPAQGEFKLLPKFIVKHGTIVRKWDCYTAKAEHDMYGKSGASGHTHRLGVYMQRDHNGNHVWVETGCLCRLDPDYVTAPNWQQGFVCMTFDRKTGAFAVEPVYIHNGLAVWRDTIYKG
jgi:hypothetical protein